MTPGDVATQINEGRARRKRSHAKSRKLYSEPVTPVADEMTVEDMTHWAIAMRKLDTDKINNGRLG